MLAFVYNHTLLVTAINWHSNHIGKMQQRQHIKLRERCLDHTTSCYSLLVISTLSARADRASDLVAEVLESLLSATIVK